MMLPTVIDGSAADCRLFQSDSDIVRLYEPYTEVRIADSSAAAERWSPVAVTFVSVLETQLPRCY